MSGEQLHTLYGMISEASEKKPDRLFYRTLFGSKELPMSVIDIEYLSFITPTLPEPLREVSDGLKDIFMKSLTSTTSVKGQMMNILTTHKSRIEVTSPAARKNVLGNLVKQQGFGGGDDY